jgi:hypothetical protein
MGRRKSVMLGLEENAGARVYIYCQRQTGLLPDQALHCVTGALPAGQECRGKEKGKEREEGRKEGKKQSMLGGVQIT